MPVPPAGADGDGLRQGGKFVRPRQQPVGLAHCMVRDRVAPNIALSRLSLQQRATAKKTPLAVAPRRRSLAPAGSRLERDS
jgi:hypothetical protein